MEDPEYPSPTISDSRRLTGPNMYSARPGVVLDVMLPGDVSTSAATDVHLHSSNLQSRWQLNVASLAKALGWPQPKTVVRGSTLFLEAPVSALMTATEVNEQAWAAAERDADVAQDVQADLRQKSDSERKRLLEFDATYAAALASNRNVIFDDDAVSTTDVPIALVTGSNGKTTTTRLVAAIMRESGGTVGYTCSDGVWIGNEQIESGDYSGPAGARIVLRDDRTDVAILETARGGMLRRGLAVTRADAAIITNVAPDHLGEYGVESLAELAEVKAIVTRALHAHSTLVLNASDSSLVEIGRDAACRVAWFAGHDSAKGLRVAEERGDDVAVVRDGALHVRRAGQWSIIGDINAFPLTLRGAAVHNIENILGAALVSLALGANASQIRSVLSTFGTLPNDNPGRLGIHTVNGITVLVDYAHNPDGLAALCSLAATLPARKRTLVLGQAGNRSDQQIRDLVGAAFDVMQCDRVVLKEMPTMLRGRAFGEITDILREQLLRRDFPSDAILSAPSELEAIELAVKSATPGDLVVAPTHVQKREVNAWLASYGRSSPA